jgi:DNA repair exonuclease SbcCD ATPase subunit
MAQDNKKVYTIVINGVKESIESIDALKSKLDALEDRIEALKGKGVTNPIGNGASSEMDEITRKAAAAVEEYRKTNQELNKTKNILGEIAKDKEKLARIDVGTSESTSSSKMVPLGSVDSSKTKGEPTYVQGKGFMVELKEAENVSSTMKEIEKTEKRIADARGEEYQSLLAAKEQLKEVKNIQSQIAAKERLFNDQYDLNTLEGLEAKLKDIKTVTKTVDIDSDMFSSLMKSSNDLNTKLNQVKESMGQSERNVGNYKSSLDGAADANEKIRISVNGQIKEYNNVRQALKSLTNEIMNLSVNGKENTQQFKQLEKTYHEFYKAVLRAKSAVNDLKASSKGMDAMLDAFTSLSAIGQIGGGLQGLFGIDGIDETIQKLMSLQSIVSGLEQIKQQLNTGEFLGGYFNKAYESIDKFVNKLFGIKDTSDKVQGVVENVAEGMEQEANASKKATTALKTQEATTVAVTVATKAATIATKAFKLALDGLVIGLIITGISWLIEKVVDFVQSLDSSKASLSEFDAACKSSEQAYKSLGDALKNDYLSGKIGYGEYMQKALDNENKYIKEQIGLLKERANLIGKDKAGLDFSAPKIPEKSDGKSFQITNVGSFGAVAYKDLDEAKKKYLELTEAARQGKDYFEKYGQGFGDSVRSLLTTVNQTDDAAKRVGNSIAMNLLDKMEDIDFTAPKAREQVKKLVDEMNNDEATRSIIAHLDEYIPDEKVRARFENIIREINRFNDAMNNIDPNEMSRVWIEGIRDPHQRAIEQINQDFKEEVVKYTGNTEWIVNVNRKRNRLLADENKRYNEEIAAKNKQAAENAKRLKEENNRKLLTADKELYNVELTMMEDGLAKQLKTIRKSYEDRIRAAKENGAKVNEVVSALNKAMEKELQDAVDKTFEELSKTASSLIKQVNDIKLENMLDGITHSAERLNDELSKLPESLEGKYFRMQSTYNEVQGYFDGEPKVKGYIKEYVDMVHELENLKNEIESDKSSIATAIVTDESALDPIRDSIKANEEKYKKLQNELENFYKENEVSQDYLEKLADTQLYRQYTEKSDLWDVYSDRQKRLEDFLEDYEDTIVRNSIRLRRKEMEQADVEKRQAIAAIDTKYNDMIKEENDYYDKLEEANKAKVSLGKATETEVQNDLMRHNDRIKAINDERRKAELKADKEYHDKIEKADEEHKKRLLDADKKVFDYEIQDIKALVTAADAIFENHGEVRNSWGIIDLGSTKKNLEQAKLMYTTAFRDIENEQEALIEDLQNEDISFGDFTNANNELNEEAKYVKGKLKEIEADSKDSIGKFIDSINTYIQAIGQGIQDVLSQVWANQDASYDKEIENLDKWIDKYEEKLQEQKDITQEYANNIDSIEDELATARGDRREKLIDDLNAQMAAQRASLAQQKMIENEKKKEVDKKEKLELQQRKKEKERAVISAIISTALATANGLATQPFVPVGIAMGALAGTLGAVQIALIKSQKYANGGIIQGRSHSQGGIKVLGGRAEVEGGEFITNKQSTSANLDILEFINSKKRRVDLNDLVTFYSSRKALPKPMAKTKFANGGEIPSLRTDLDINDKLITMFEEFGRRPSVVSVVDIIKAQDKVNKVRTLAGVE